MRMFLETLLGGARWMGNRELDYKPGGTALVSCATVTNYHTLGGVKQQKFTLTVLEAGSLKPVFLGPV